MKVRPSTGLMCSECYRISRNGRVGVRCRANPKHNQTQPIQKKRKRKF